MLNKIRYKVIHSQVISASSCERNWSAYGHIHTKICNRLDATTTEKPVYVCSNSKLVASTRDADKTAWVDRARPGAPRPTMLPLSMTVRFAHVQHHSGIAKPSVPASPRSSKGDQPESRAENSISGQRTVSLEEFRTDGSGSRIRDGRRDLTSVPYTEDEKASTVRAASPTQSTPACWQYNDGKASTDWRQSLTRRRL